MELLLLSFLLLCSVAPARVHASPKPLNQENTDFPITRSPVELHRRAIFTPGNATCGYRDGDLSLSWVAATGSACAVDFEKGYFGFCATTVTDIADCPIVNACVDKHTCSVRCGRSDATSVLSCTGTTSGTAYDYCYTNVLYSNTQSFTWLGCDPNDYRSWVYSAAENVITETPSASTSLASTPSPNPAASTTGATATGTQSSNPPSSGGSSSNTGAIVGGVVGGLAVLALAGLGFFFLRRRKAKKQPGLKTAQPELDAPEYTPPTAKYAYQQVEPEAEQGPNELPAPMAAPVPVAELHTEAQSPRELPGDESYR